MVNTTQGLASNRGRGAADAELIGRAQAGDLQAFEELVRARLDRVLRTACVVLGNEADAADATQDAFIAAWRKLHTLREPDRLDAWLARILLNECRMRLRDRRRVREITVGDVATLGDLAPSERLETTDVELVRRAFDRLSADDRMLLALHYVDREPLRQIAAATGAPVGTIKWRLFRARRALAHAFEAEQ